MRHAPRALLRCHNLTVILNTDTACGHGHGHLPPSPLSKHRCPDSCQYPRMLRTSISLSCARNEIGRSYAWWFQVETANRARGARNLSRLNSILVSEDELLIRKCGDVAGVYFPLHELRINQVHFKGGLSSSLTRNIGCLRNRLYLRLRQPGFG